MKKLSLLIVGLACSASLALPAAATAGSVDIEPVSGSFPMTFTASGGAASLTTASSTVGCASSKASGEYENNSTGWIIFTLHSCKGPLGVSCTTSGQPSGTIVTTVLPLHLRWGSLPRRLLNLFTMPASLHLMTFSCFGITTVVSGNGVIGETTAPGCGATTKTATLSLESSSAGVQKWMQITETGTSYELTAKIGGGGAETASLDAGLTVTLERESKFNCT